MIIGVIGAIIGIIAFPTRGREWTNALGWFMALCAIYDRGSYWAASEKEPVEPPLVVVLPRFIFSLALGYFLLSGSLSYSAEPTPLEIPPGLVIPEEFREQPAASPNTDLKPIPRLELLVPVGNASTLACPLDASVIVNAMEYDTVFVCSGTVVDSSVGCSTILTCAHEFKGLKNPKITVIHNKKEYQARLLRKDEANDLSLLIIPGELPVVDLATEKPKVGDTVRSIGMENLWLVERDHRITAIDKYSSPRNIESDGQQSLGRSGGGLFFNGQLCGMVQGRRNDVQRSIYVSIEPIREILKSPLCGTVDKTLCRLWMAPFHCPPCHRLQKALGNGNDRVTIEVYTHPKDKLTPEHNFPYVEIIDSHGKSTALYNIESLSHLEKNIDRIESEYAVPVGSQEVGAAIAGKAVIEQTFDFIDQFGGAECEATFVWHREGGLDAMPIGKSVSFQEFSGTSGHIELTVTATKKLPVHSVNLDYKWENGKFFVRAPDWIEVQLPEDGTVGATQKPVGSVMLAYTILSIAYDLWQLAHPTMDVYLGKDVSMSAKYSNRTLTVDCGPTPPAVRLHWAFMMGLLRFELSRPVTGLVVSTQNIQMQFHKSRLFRDVNMEVK